MYYKQILKVAVLLLTSLNYTSCEDFVEVDTPDYRLDSAAVFSNDDSAQSALNGLLNQLLNTSFSGGGAQSVTFLAGLSSDNFILNSTSPDLIPIYRNQIPPDNSYNLALWSGAYNTIYQANALIDNTIGNERLSQQTKDRLEGSGKFIRAFTYFYLVNLYGAVPLLAETEYQENALAERSDSDVIYNFILHDLQDAAELLEDSYINNDRTRPNRFTALALLARLHLYLGNWEEAAQNSALVISHSQYDLEQDLNAVFLANSNEAIWQISPVGWGNSFTHTREGNLFIKTPTAVTPVELSESFLNSLNDPLDKRITEWVDVLVDDGDSLYYPYKYKVQYDFSGGEITEYSMVLRLAEQYLILAEAQLNMNNISEALKNLNSIRSRAGREALTLIDINKTELANLILEERRREFFAEWGHRWFDLKRLELSESLRSKQESNWSASSVLFPIPSQERLNNPNLNQNPGY